MHPPSPGAAQRSGLTAIVRDGWAASAKHVRWPGFVPRRVRGPVGLLGLLVLAQWIGIVVFTTTVNHNGWLFYQGGDQAAYYTGAWSIAHGHIPGTEISYGWSYVLAPLAAVFGPDILRTLPAIMLLQVVVLLPVALVCVYGIAARIGGRLLGSIAALVWVAGPFLAIPLWEQDYHDRYVDQFLPQAFGLSGLADCASAVAVLVAAYVTVRALDSDAVLDAALAGLATGFAIGIKPANALFLPAPILAFVVARRFRGLFPFGVALIPALLTLALWKLKGLGSVPLFPNEPQALAVGTGAVGAPAVASVGHYVHLNYDQLHENYLGLRQYFWNVRLLQWLPVAGVVGAARRTPALAVLLGAWLAAFVFLKGSAAQASIQEGTFLRLFLPAMPALALLATAIPLLWPRLRRLAPLPERRPLAAGWRSPAFIAGVVAFALVPLALVAALPPLHTDAAAKVSVSNTFVPVTDFGLRAERLERGIIRLSWRSQAVGTTDAFYTVFREHSQFPIPKGSPPFPIVHDGMFCRTGLRGASHCSIEMQPVGVSRSPTFAEGPPAGNWTYRVAVTANWLNNTDLGDPLLISRPLTVVIQ